MGAQISKQSVSTSPNVQTTTTATSHAVASQQRIVQNFVLIWVDSNIDESKKDFQNTLTHLRSIVNDVTIWRKPEQCIQCLQDLTNEKAFVITSGSLGQDLVSKIHSMSQVDVIYVFCANKPWHEQWAKKWSKINGVYTDIEPICEALQVAAKQCNEDSVAVSFLFMREGASADNLNQLEPSFMYTQIFKEILLKIEHEKHAVKDLANYCRGLYQYNMAEINVINEFEQKYCAKSAIWWYTRECFTYQMLNRALRNLEGDTIVNMGFFISDLHRQIEALHKKQVSNYKGETFLVYRGQGLSTADFEKLRKTRGGLMSFNNFLSTSKNQGVSLKFAKGALEKTDMVSILFIMTINPKISSTPFATIRDYSYFQKEEEILFSMHTVFRISDIKQMNKTNPFYQVELQLTADDDEQLRALTKRMREEVGGSGWERMGKLLVKIGQFNKAEELNQALLEKTSNKDDKAYYYNQLGSVKDGQGDYKKAIWYYEQGLQIEEKILPPNHPDLATSYSNIGVVYDKMGEYSKALSFNEKSLEIRQKTLPPNHSDLAASYNNVASVYNNVREYSKALSFYEKSLEICQKTLPSNHPHLAISYNNIGEVYGSKGEYSKALLFHERALNILKSSLPSNHPDIKDVENNIKILKEEML